MVDYNAIDIYLDAKSTKKYFIKHNELITWNEFIKIRESTKKYSSTEVMSTVEILARPKKNEKSNYIIFENECPRCKTNVVVELSKTEFRDFIGTNKYYLCKDCSVIQLEEIKKQEEEQQIKRDIENEKQKELNLVKKEKEEEIKIKSTNMYIDFLLDTKKSWQNDCKFFTKWDIVTGATKIYGFGNPYLDWDIIAGYIKNMNYYEFLKTPYWKAVSERKRRSANFKCQLCNSKLNIVTHHKTYEIRGYEHENLDQLIVLCKKCHEKHHDIKKVEEVIINE